MIGKRKEDGNNSEPTVLGPIPLVFTHSRITGHAKAHDTDDRRRVLYTTTKHSIRERREDGHGASHAAKTDCMRNETLTSRPQIPNASTKEMGGPTGEPTNGTLETQGKTQWGWSVMRMGLWGALSSKKYEVTGCLHFHLHQTNSCGKSNAGPV